MWNYKKTVLKRNLVKIDVSHNGVVKPQSEGWLG